MEQTSTSCQISVYAQLRSENAAKLGNFDRVIENILSVACTVLQTTEKLDKFVVKTVNISFDNSTFALLLDAVLDLTAGFIDHFLDAGGVDSAVSDKLFQSDPCHLTADLIEAGKCNSFGSIVDDKVNAGESLQSTDISTLTSDDTSLHFVIRQGNYRNSGF